MPRGREDLKFPDRRIIRSRLCRRKRGSEARGIGILQMTHAQDVPIALAIELVGRNQVERMPESAFFDCLGLQVPLVSLHAFDTSTPAKIKFLMRSL